MNLKHIVIVLSVIISTLSAHGQTNVGVFLPFKANNATTAQHAIEFYRGLLMAADSLTHSGISFRITADDCGSTTSDIKALLDETKHGIYDIIFAPSNTEQIKEINSYSVANGTKVLQPLGGMYDEQILNPNFYALKVTQTDYSAPAYKLISTTLRNKKITILSTSANGQLCPFAYYVSKTVKGTKVLQWPSKENKILKTLADEDALIIPAHYDDQTLQTILQISQQLPTVKATIIGYPNWIETNKSNDFHKQLAHVNTHVICTTFPRQNLPRVRNFENQYKNNFNSTIPTDAFSYAKWGFDTGYHFLKAMARHKRYYKSQPIYTAPLQNAFDFAPRASGQGYINTYVLLIRYKTDGSQDIITLK